MKTGLVVSIVVIIILTIVLLCVPLAPINTGVISTLWDNLKIISNVLWKVLPLLIILILTILFLIGKFSIKVKEINVGGFQLLLEHPTKLYVQKVKTYLDTKRSIFKIDTELDNYKEVFDSYFEIYQFLRREVNLVAGVNGKFEATATRQYQMTMKAIKELNAFLTDFQSDFRRWYDYHEKNYHIKGIAESFYLNPIDLFQKTYDKSKRDKLERGFEKINKFFCDEFAKEFGVPPLFGPKTMLVNF